MTFVNTQSNILPKNIFPSTSNQALSKKSKSLVTHKEKRR